MSSSQLIEIVVLALACYRISNILASPYEDAPYSIAKKHRLVWGRLAANRRDRFGGGTAHTIAQLFNCPHCAGVWIAFVLTFIVFGLTGKAVLFAFAVAGLQSFMYGLTRVSHG